MRKMSQSTKPGSDAPAKVICCAFLTTADIWRRPGTCTRTATVERNGKPYCYQHDPDALRARRDAEAAAWRAEYQRKQERQLLESAAPDLLAALKSLLACPRIAGCEPGHKDPETEFAECAARAAIAKAEAHD